MSQEHHYTYGVIEADAAPLDLDIEGIGGAPVYTIEQGRYAAVVSDIDTLEPEETEENATAHDEVLRAVLTGDPDGEADPEDGQPVVPMQFGMVFDGTRPLKHVLRGGRASFRRALRTVEGRVEMGVKVVTPDEGVEDPDAVRDAIADRLAEHSVAQAEGDLFSDRLLLNGSYLVEREERAAFDDAIDDLREEHGSLTIQYTGPWAPYNFVDIEIGVEQ